MQKYANNVVNQLGAVVPGVTVIVNAYPSGSATLYTGNGTGLLASNVLIADTNGYFSFYAANGRYTLTIQGSTFPTVTVPDIILYDPRISSNEVPTGTINSSNVTFTLLYAPIGNVTGVVRQGGGGAFLPLVLGTDFTVSGTTVTMTLAPDTGSNLEFTYAY